LQQTKYIAPTTETEQVLCEIWQEVLGIERVGINDNFFELGGHSLTVVKLLTRLQLQYQHNSTLQIKDMFECKNLSVMACLLDEMSAQNENEQLKKKVAEGLEIDW